MCLPKLIKIFVFCAAVFCQACSFWQISENSKNSNTTFAANDLKYEIPFSSREPDVFQAEIVLTTFANGEKSERKIFTARKAAKQRYDFENETSFLRTSENQSFLIDNNRRVFAENQTNSNVSDEAADAVKDFLTTDWLNEKRGAAFEKIGTENDLTKYLVRFADAPKADSEVLIFVDENLKIPIRQEFYAANGEQKILLFSMELRNFQSSADDNFFELPKDFRQVSLSDFQKSLRPKAPLKK